MEGKLFKQFRNYMTEVLLMYFGQENLYTETEYDNLLAKEFDKKLNQASIRVIQDDNLIEAAEIPIFVGTLTKPFGNNGYHMSEIGTPVYEYKGLYQIETYPIDTKLPMKIVTFYKDRFISLQHIKL